MPTKKGAGGRQQNYDPHTGRFAKTNFFVLPPFQPTRKEKARKKEELRRKNLYDRAKNSKDALVFETFCAIEQELPGSVQFVNESRFDPILNNNREFDIITKKCIIEVKSGASASLKQFRAQQRFAKSKNKSHIVFAPNMPTMAKIAHEQNGIRITRDYSSLINAIKEHEK